MTTDSDGARRALVRALVAEFAPQELPDFDLMTGVYFAAPGAARRARRARDEPGASGIDLGDPTLTNLLWGVVGGLMTEMVVIGVRDGRSRLRRWRERRRAGGPEAPVPELGESADQVRRRIVKELEAAGRDHAEAIAERAVERWSRRDWTPPQ
ncbi:hypothetical protein ACIBKY_18095 [Nonomuraea sp. NPDC050394]|uniref:hypothetical protein n=1 Tax=Nonomuraea sp. NPDC050394 TaxID=3364363 RepID=UPI00378AC2C1